MQVPNSRTNRACTYEYNTRWSECGYPCEFQGDIIKNIGLADALIFATANEYSKTLCSANKKHYKEIVSLSVKEFRPKA